MTARRRRIRPWHRGTLLIDPENGQLAPSSDGAVELFAAGTEPTRVAEPAAQRKFFLVVRSPPSFCRFHFGRSESRSSLAPRKAGCILFSKGRWIHVPVTAAATFPGASAALGFDVTGHGEKMTLPPTLQDMSPPPAEGGPIVLYNVSWEQYEGLLALFGDEHPSLRMTYVKGTLEIMTTSPEHEFRKKLIARLLELWAMERGVTLEGYGGATFRKRAAERGLEPDECYSLGALVDVPHIAIEVVHRHGGIDKLDVYAGLRVPEVWFWEEGRLAVYRLVGEGYERLAASELLSALDVDQLSEFLRREGTQTETVRAYRDALRATG